ncbi:GNAT family N-acetyltransferase [Streptomyces triticisoli]|jgi:GNAT superfamily N-acetyltransferase|uniref:GNAT family N-acetyltransferase n=1 Tax=Streptomyces triticisoli TaxID=2182797 RepID=UPI000DD6CCF1|nr:GNAT family N-acetyltransferase [Streptomyces triticisoli]
MGVGIRSAGQDDRARVVRLLDEAFQDDPVSGWVFPGEEYRRTTHHRLMTAFTDIVLEEGRIDVTEDGTACALWLSIPVASPDDMDDSDDAVRLRETVDPANARVEEIARLMADFHPADRAHEYLWMIGVTPARQGEGLGSALIQHALDHCDHKGLPAYLEASSKRSITLYERLGFTFTGRTLDLPDGPRMWPMWREPRTP